MARAPPLSQNILDFMANKSQESLRVFSWITNLTVAELRYEALRELAMRRDFPDLGLMLWYAGPPSAVTALLLEVTASYTPLLSKTLNVVSGNRVCYAMTLFQAIAAHPQARIPFLRSEILMYLLPILDVTVQTLPVEHLRLSVLGVIGDLVKISSNEVIKYLLEHCLIIPKIFRFMELGSEMSKAITAFILRRILEHDVGLQYFTTNNLFCYHLIFTLAKVVHQLTLEPEARILKSIVGCYKCLSVDKSCRIMLQEHLPEQLRNAYFCNELGGSYQDVTEDLLELNHCIGWGTDDSSTGQDADCSSTSSSGSAF